MSLINKTMLLLKVSIRYTIYDNYKTITNSTELDNEIELISFIRNAIEKLVILLIVIASLITS